MAVPHMICLLPAFCVNFLRLIPFLFQPYVKIKPLQRVQENLNEPSGFMTLIFICLFPIGLWVGGVLSFKELYICAPSLCAFDLYVHCIGDVFVWMNKTKILYFNPYLPLP